MSFGFAAIGKRDDVVKQLRHVQVGHDNDNKVGREVALLLARHIADDAPSNYLGSGYEQVYTVKASGHSGGGSALSLNVTVESHYILVPPDEEATETG